MTRAQFALFARPLARCLFVFVLCFFVCSLVLCLYCAFLIALRLPLLRVLRVPYCFFSYCCCLFSFVVFYMYSVCLVVRLRRWVFKIGAI